MMTGIDISAWQENIDWQAVKDYGVKFVIVKMGQGGRLDSMYYNHIRDALNAGMLVGVYIYSVATSPEDAQFEADFVHKQLNGLTPDMGIWFDAEDPRMLEGDVTATCAAFISRLQGYGYDKVGVYASYNWLTNGNVEASILKCPIWCAQYNSTCDYNSRYLVMWQYTDRMNIIGVNYDGNAYLLG